MKQSITADTVLDWLDYYAEQQADFSLFNFLRDGETELDVLTYARFQAEAQRVAAYLQANNLSGERILLLFPQANAYLIALFGCFYAGAIAVPAYPPRGNRNWQRLQAIVADAGAQAVLAPQAQIQQLRRFQETFEHFQQLTYEEAVATDAPFTANTITADQIAYLQYTSGSTGNPKGVIINHGNILHNVAGMDEIFKDRTLHGGNYVTWLPMYHDMGLMNMMSALKNAAHCYYMSPVHFIQKPARWLQAISRYRAEYTLGPNFAFDYCCDKIEDKELDGVDLRRLTAITNGSEPVRLATMARFAERFAPWGIELQDFCPAYGMAEATLIVSTVKLGDPLHIRHKTQTDSPPLSLHKLSDLPPHPEAYHTSSGAPVSTATITIVHPQKLVALPDGVEGEIWVHNPGSIASGYWNREAENAAIFRARRSDKAEVPYLRTGDLGFLQDGQLYVTGRIKDMVIVRGRNYYPQDIEEVMQQSHEALEPHSGAAFAVEGATSEELVLVQEVSRHYLREADTEAIMQAMRTAVSQVFDIVPQHIALIKPLSLPKTSSGKIQRYLTREQWLQQQLRLIDHWPKQGPAATTPIVTTSGDPRRIDQQAIAHWLVRQIAQKAKMPPSEIDLRAAVRDYPVESIEAIGMADELTKWLGIRLTAEVFWALPSIEELAAFLYKKYQEQSKK
ncbi:MAG: AMP-dependent synthetase [Bacteroidetes bacterium]|nr:MAG: AMP-dependent synthetase [Bacteroidota bacterium]